MPIFDLYSKRQRKMRGEMPEVYIYDRLPHPLRVQIIQIWSHTLGGRKQYYEGNVRHAYTSIVKVLRHEYGVFRLTGANAKSMGMPEDIIDELYDFFLNEQDIDKALDAVELSFKYIDVHTRDYDYLSRYRASKIADSAIKDLNYRFNQHGVGYQYKSSKIVRIDSELMHAEVVRPALRLLCQKQYVGPQEEFLQAHEHYRKGHAKEALNYWGLYTKVANRT